MEAHWDWCHNCGFDPEGKKAAADAAAAAAAPAAVTTTFTAPLAPPPPTTGLAFPNATADVPAYPLPSEPDPVDESYEDHPYADLPYTQEPLPPPPMAASAPPPTVMAAPPPVVTAAPPRVESGTADAYPGGAFNASTSSPPPAIGPGGPGGPGLGPGAGWTPEGEGRPGFNAPAASNNVGKFALIGLIGLLVIGVLAVGLFKLADSDSTAAKPTTTLDPKAPKPLGAVSLGGKPAPSGGSTPSTTAGASTDSTTAPTDGWVTYKAPDGSFAIDFPGDVKTKSGQDIVAGAALTHVSIYHLVGTEGTGYQASYYDLVSASEFADAQDAFDKINATATKEGEAMTAAGPIEVAGKTGVLYTGTTNGKAERGVILLVGNRLYDLSTLDVDDANSDRFIHSFHLN